jgi:hypothetical protein
MKLRAAKNVFGLGIDEEGIPFELKLKTHDAVLLLEGAVLSFFIFRNEFTRLGG